MSNNIFTEYLAIAENEKGDTHIRLSVWYQPKASRRGYYATVVPVQRDGYFERAACFSGYNCRLSEVSRKSKKREQEAMDVFTEKRPLMLEHILSEYGYVLVD